MLIFDKSDEGNFELLASIGLLLVVHHRRRSCWSASACVGRDFMLRRTAA